MHQIRWVGIFFFLGSVAIVGCQPPPVAVVTPEATNVEIGKPQVLEVTDYEEFTGHTDAILSVQVKARVSGYLMSRNFVEGEEVREGDVLYEIDDRPYKTALMQSESAVAQNEAHRVRLEADHRRANNLFKKAMIGRQEYDLISSNYSEAQSALQGSKAQLDIARLNMGFTKVRASMNGQISRTLVDPGNMVKQEQTILTDIVAVDKLYVYFDLNEDALRRVHTLIEEGLVKGGNAKEVPVVVGLSDNENFPYKGIVNFSENKLDAATGTLRLRGVIDNPRPWILSPGLFVRVRLLIGDPHPVVLVRDEAVGSDQGRSFVYLVDRQDEVEYRPVEIGPSYDGLRAIRKGLSEADRLIIDADGIRKVRPGAKVAPKINDKKSVPPTTAPMKTALR